MRIVVCGSTGNTGQQVVRELSKEGHTVVAVTRNPESAAAKELLALPNVVAKTLETALDQPADRAYLAFNNGSDHFVNETDFLMRAQRAGVKYVVKLATTEGSMGIYQDPFYGRSHLAVEFFLEQGTIPFTSLRPTLFYQSLGVDLHTAAKTGQAFTILPSGKIQAAISAEDVGHIAATLLALKDPSPHYSKKYVLSGPEDVSEKSMAVDLSEVLGREVTVGTIPRENFKTMILSAGYTEAHFESLLRGQQTLYERGADLKSSPTSSEILALAPPKTTFKDYARKAIATSQ